MFRDLGFTEFSMPVPEPAAIVLLFIASCGLLPRRRR